MPRRRLAAMLPLALIAGAATARAPATPDAGVAAAVTAFADARDHFDAAALDRLLAPDYLEISPRGAIDERQAVLGFYAPDKAAPAPAMTRTTQTVRIHGDTAIVIGAIGYTMPAPAGAASPAVARTLRVSYVLRRIAGRWLVASTHYSPVQPTR